MTEEKTYTIVELSERLKISQRTIQRKLYSRELSGKFYINRWRFTEQDVQAFINRKTRNDNKGVAVKRAYNKKEKTE
jgi:excisionase family DNA binding protein